MNAAETPPAPAPTLDEEVGAMRVRLFEKSVAYRALVTDPFAVLGPVEPDLPF